MAMRDRYLLVCPHAQNLGNALPGGHLVRGWGNAQVIRLLGTEGDHCSLDNGASGPAQWRERDLIFIATVINHCTLSDLQTT